DVAVVDARDPHAVEEIAHWLKAPVRMVRTSLVSMEAALRHLHGRPNEPLRPLAAPISVPSARSDPPRAPAEAPPSGSPAYLEPGAAEGQERPPDSSAVDSLVGSAPNIPIPLMRRSIVPVAIIDVGPPAIERGGGGGGARTPDDSQLSTLRGPPGF